MVGAFLNHQVAGNSHQSAVSPNKYSIQTLERVYIYNAGEIMNGRIQIPSARKAVKKCVKFISSDLGYKL